MSMDRNSVSPRPLCRRIYRRGGLGGQSRGMRSPSGILSASDLTRGGYFPQAQSRCGIGRGLVRGNGPKKSVFPAGASSIPGICSTRAMMVTAIPGATSAPPLIGDRSPTPILTKPLPIVSVGLIRGVQDPRQHPGEVNLLLSLMGIPVFTGWSINSFCGEGIHIFDFRFSIYWNFRFDI